MIRHERLTAHMDGEFVVFLIGMRINRPLMVHKWLPVILAMPKMIKDSTHSQSMAFCTQKCGSPEPP